jgi:hypothetical protein
LPEVWPHVDTPDSATTSGLSEMRYKTLGPTKDYSLQEIGGRPMMGEDGAPWAFLNSVGGRTR